MPVLFVRNYLQKNKRELLHFVVVGVATGCLLLGLFYYFFTILKFTDRKATTYAYVITAFAHFIFNRNLTFKARSSSIGAQFIKYFTMLTINYLLILLGLWFITAVMLLPPFVNIIFSIFTNAASSYLIMKFFVFKSK